MTDEVAEHDNLKTIFLLMRQIHQQSQEQFHLQAEGELMFRLHDETHIFIIKQ